MVVEWSFEGPPEEDDGLTYYSRVRARFTTGTSTRVFRIGECVRIDTGDPTQEWIAQIVELFDKGGRKKHRMKVSLRWLYHPKDIAYWHPDERIGMYWSEHIDINSVEVIAGRAFLFDSEQELSSFKEGVEQGPRPANFWPRDVAILVQHYYQNNAMPPPPLRRLDKDELQFLLDNPSAEPMYHSFRDMQSKRIATESSANHKPVVSLRAASESPSRRRPISMPDKLTEIKPTEERKKRTSPSKSPSRRGESPSRENESPKEIQSGKRTGLSKKSTKKQTPSSVKHSVPATPKDNERQRSHPELPTVPRKRKGSTNNQPSSPKTKASKSPSNQVIIENFKRDNAELEKRSDIKDISSFQKKNGKNERKSGSAPLKTNRYQMAAEQVEKVEKKAVLAEHNQDNDVDMDLSEDDPMELELPQTNEPDSDDGFGHLASSIEQLSENLKRYAFNNLDAHVQLIRRRMEQRGLTFDRMDDNQMNVFAEQITDELMD